MTDDQGPARPGYRGTLQPDCVTLAEVLKPSGYGTYMVGKWHLRNQSDVKPTDRGFDEFYGMLGGYNSCWDENPYYTRWPKNRTPRTYTSAKNGRPGTFYSTDAFADYSLDFMAQSRNEKKPRSEEHTSELQSLRHLVCRLLLEKKLYCDSYRSIDIGLHYPELRDLIYHLS